MDLWSLGMLSFFLFFWNKWFISVKSEHWELRSVLMFQIKDGMVFGVLECFFGCWIAANLCFKWRSVCLCEFSCEIEFFFDVWNVIFVVMWRFERFGEDLCVCGFENSDGLISFLLQTEWCLAMFDIDINAVCYVKSIEKWRVFMLFRVN